jgi:hypothetical protein
VRYVSGPHFFSTGSCITTLPTHAGM